MNLSSSDPKPQARLLVELAVLVEHSVHAELAAQDAEHAAQLAVLVEHASPAELVAQHAELAAQLVMLVEPAASVELAVSVVAVARTSVWARSFAPTNLTVMNGATPVSISQCNLPGKTIVIDSQQDLTEVEYDISGGRMKVEFHRKLNTGDCTDLVPTADTPYYMIIAMGTKGNMNVAGHGYSDTHNVVCMGSMMNTIERKPPSEWDAEMPPSLPATTSMAPGLSGSAGLSLALFLLQ